MALQKIDNLRQDIRRAEKLRREMETRIEEANAESSKERRLRERSEEYCKQMEHEMDSLKQKISSEEFTPCPNDNDVSQEVSR